MSVNARIGRAAAAAVGGCRAGRAACHTRAAHGLDRLRHRLARRGALLGAGGMLGLEPPATGDGALRPAGHGACGADGSGSLGHQPAAWSGTGGRGASSPSTRWRCVGLRRASTRPPGRGPTSSPGAERRRWPRLRTLADPGLEPPDGHLAVSGWSPGSRTPSALSGGPRAVEAAAAEARLLAQQAQLAALRAQAEPPLSLQRAALGGGAGGKRPGAAPTARWSGWETCSATRSHAEEQVSFRPGVGVHPGLPRLRGSCGWASRLRGRARAGRRRAAGPGPAAHPPAAGGERRPPRHRRSAGGRADRAAGPASPTAGCSSRSSDDGAGRTGAKAGHGRGRGLGRASALAVLYGGAATSETAPASDGLRGSASILPCRHGAGRGARG